MAYQSPNSDRLNSKALPWYLIKHVVYTITRRLYLTLQQQSISPVTMAQRIGGQGYCLQLELELLLARHLPRLLLLLFNLSIKHFELLVYIHTHTHNIYIHVLVFWCTSIFKYIYYSHSFIDVLMYYIDRHSPDGKRKVSQMYVIYSVPVRNTEHWNESLPTKFMTFRSLLWSIIYIDYVSIGQLLLGVFFVGWSKIWLCIITIIHHLFRRQHFLFWWSRVLVCSWLVGLGLFLLNCLCTIWCTICIYIWRINA